MTEHGDYTNPEAGFPATCMRCGAMVENKPWTLTLHDEWHGGLHDYIAVYESGATDQLESGP